MNQGSKKEQENEEKRLEVLSKYRVLDTPPERDFDDLVKLAAQICNTPISLVSLVDRDRQWFKGRYGLQITETPRRLSFCSHTIKNASQAMVVPDAAADERFSNNDLVTGPLHLRFYAGVPLVTPEGQALGTLCVIDRKPRELSAEQKEALRILTKQVMTQLELRRRLAELQATSDSLAEAHARETRRHSALEREHARELHRSEERFRAIFEHAGLGIGELDADGRFTIINDRWCQIVHRSRSELLAMTVHELTHPDDREATCRLNAALVSGSVPWISYEKRYLSGGDAGFVWVRVTVTSIRAEDSAFLRGIVMVEDITERKRFLAELERCVAERTTSLRQAMAELEAFSYSLSHDMRAPLRAVQSFTSMVLETNRARLDDDGVSGLERVLHATDRMNQLITDVLAFSQVSRAEVDMQLVDVQAAVQTVISEHPGLQPPQAMVQVQTPLPRVWGHPVLLTQSFANILGNAVKFVRPGVAPAIRIYSERHGAFVRLVIQDNGIGIPHDAQQKIFDLFERLHSQKEYEGTGLGLAIVKRAVERMGGSVGVDSEPGQGSRFWIELPEAGPPGAQAL